MLMTVQEYVKMPYQIIIQEMNDESGHYFFASVAELKGCMSDGETAEKAYANIKEAMEVHIESMLDENIEVPLPSALQKEKYSGKFVVRIPKSLHCKLVLQAEREGVSLNQFALYKLSL